MNTKVCTKCHQEKPLSDYNKGRKKEKSEGHYLRPNCKPCDNQRSRDYHNLNRDKIHAKNREWRIKSKYDISIERYNELLNEQKHLCAICGKKSSDALNRKLAVDHDHETGEVRGLLCGNCNNGLGRFKDDISLLEKAISYLKESKK